MAAVVGVTRGPHLEKEEEKAETDGAVVITTGITADSTERGAGNKEVRMQA